MADADDIRARVLAIYGINEDDPDWVAFNNSSYALASDAARELEQQYRDVYLPAMIAKAETELVARCRCACTLPDGLTIKFDVD